MCPPIFMSHLRGHSEKSIVVHSVECAATLENGQRHGLRSATSRASWVPGLRMLAFPTERQLEISAPQVSGGGWGGELLLPEGSRRKQEKEVRGLRAGASRPLSHLWSHRYWHAGFRVNRFRTEVSFSSSQAKVLLPFYKVIPFILS